MGSQVHRLAGSAAVKQRPFSAMLELTYRCNWRCVFCYNPRHRDLVGMSLDDYLPLLDDLRALGTMSLTLTGGEPLEHPEFFDIASAARARHFAIRIYTNGSLVDDEVADRIARLYPLSVEFSLHGATAATHDRATAVSGSLEAMLRGLAALKARGVGVELKSPVTSLNEHELEAMIELAARLEVPYKLDATITPRDNGDLSPLRFAPSDEAIRRTLAIGLTTGSVSSVERVAGQVNCGIGSLTLVVDPEGNLFPCHQWRHAPLGNVKRSRLTELWMSSSERQEARAVARAANDMLAGRGGVEARAAFCPALAREVTGDPLSLDPQFLRRARLTAEIAEELKSRKA